MGAPSAGSRRPDGPSTSARPRPRPPHGRTAGRETHDVPRHPVRDACSIVANLAAGAHVAPGARRGVRRRAKGPVGHGHADPRRHIGRARGRCVQREPRDGVTGGRRPDVPGHRCEQDRPGPAPVHARSDPPGDRHAATGRHARGARGCGSPRSGHGPFGVRGGRRSRHAARQSGCPPTEPGSLGRPRPGPVSGRLRRHQGARGAARSGAPLRPARRRAGARGAAVPDGQRDERTVHRRADGLVERHRAHRRGRQDRRHRHRDRLHARGLRWLGQAVRLQRQRRGLAGGQRLSEHEGGRRLRLRR